MTDAPERIWVDDTLAPEVLSGFWTEPPSACPNAIEYIRADLPAAVTVKPLEWDDNLAQTIIGAYTYGVIGRCWRVYFNGRIVASGEETTFCDALKAAKAHAQEYHAEQVAKLVNVTPAPGEQPVTEGPGPIAKNCTLDPMPREDLKLPPMIRTTEQQEYLSRVQPDVVQEDAQSLLETMFPKRCKGGDIDAFNGDCLWCGAPIGGTCQDAALRAREGGE